MKTRLIRSAILSERVCSGIDGPTHSLPRFLRLPNPIPRDPAIAVQ